MGYEIISNDQTAASLITVPSAETNLKTVGVRGNSFKLIGVKGVIKITTDGTSTAQNVTFKVKPGVAAGNTKSFVYVSKAAISTEFITIEHIARSNDKDDARITIQGAAADANTDIVCESMVVYGIY